METIQNQTFDAERALYGSDGVFVKDCAFDGPADGESALKESRHVKVSHCFMNLRYPFWHDEDLEIADSELTPLCRAALWYSKDVRISNTKLHGIKAVRECDRVEIENCDIVSPEFGWSARGLTMRDTTVQSEYFMLRAENLTFQHVTLDGKYSFQYIADSTFKNCTFHTKDAFWHAKHVTVYDSVLEGEYLAWYSEDLTLVRCRISGTQPFCYCKHLTLIDCEMVGTDLCFEKSEVEATVTTPVVSIKNPLAGRIVVPAVGEEIFDDPNAKGQVVVASGHPVCA